MSLGQVKWHAPGQLASKPMIFFLFATTVSFPLMDLQRCTIISASTEPQDVFLPDCSMDYSLIFLDPSQTPLLVVLFLWVLRTG